MRFIKNLIAYCLPALAVVILFRVVFCLIYVPTTSMEPEIRANSLCLSWRLPYLLFSEHEVDRGDIVVFYSAEKHKDLCKRVIGLPGEHISFRDGDVYINGEFLDDYSAEPHSTFCGRTFDVPEGCVFCMGDNRLNSADCRLMEDPYIEISTISSRILGSVHLPNTEEAVEEN